MDYKDLGAKVRATRRQHKMTQEQLAEAVGISASFLGHIERGTRIASVDTLVALCNTLDVSADYLLQGSLYAQERYMPDALSEGNRNKLREFLRLAESAVSKWED